ncbi:MAG: hypothetical protein IKF68_00180 [Erysipelotrichaceae bacterium]|nr:hypothetical protein [Erysipelotrichaceae bacterium]
MKHVFIVNRISGQGLAFSLVDIIKEICERKKLDYVIEISEYQGAVKDIVPGYNHMDDVTFYSVGGDGTFLEVLNSMDNRHPVAVIPGGSGNDFYRSFYGVASDFRSLIEKTIDVEPVTIDCGQSADMKFANTNSAGVDAQMSYDAVQIIRKTPIPKGPAYGLSIIYNAIVLKSVKVNMTVDGKDMSGEYYAINCMNGRYYGNGVKCAPASEMDDGLFDLVLVPKAARLKIYGTLIKYLKGIATEKDGVRTIRCKDVVVDSLNGKFAVQTDGENYRTSHLEAHILPAYLKIKIAK